MRKFTEAVVNFVKREDGPTAVEYAVMLALIIVVCLAAITTLGQNANTTFTTVGNKIGSAQLLFALPNIAAPRVLVVGLGESKKFDAARFARVNGEEWGRGNSSSMYWKFEDLISYITRSETLYPGEFLGSGTVGNGCGLEHMRFIKPGDVIELEVERIGVLRNHVGRKGEGPRRVVEALGAY